MCAQVFCWLADWGQPGSWSQWNVLHLNVFHWDISECLRGPKACTYFRPSKKPWPNYAFFFVQKWGDSGLGPAKMFSCKESNFCHFMAGYSYLTLHFHDLRILHAEHSRSVSKLHWNSPEIKNFHKTFNSTYSACWVNSNTCSHIQECKGDSYLVKQILSFTLHHLYIATTNYLSFWHCLLS